ncbi:MAG: 1-(5-phosphoribosyl)-5-[(5-phosphoribosylamino)methylideneamino]imidazole-4-carboxamide isomerase [Firmicutes bacterium]|nr:1-(5-phosphoribosyl)-5-[(5-phosphoribosylamino)methylideneamino]imidazole-4-carboxamide isomerase [Bacillota bacterium]
MQIIPAVDIRGGKCVRLVHGDLNRETVYEQDPVAAACRWEAEGATRLHLVDLDGAFDGKMKNAAVIEKIVHTVKIPVQVGGGIRTIETAENLLQLGVSYIILGTVAVTEPKMVATLCERYPGRIIVGIDARDGRVAIKGWVQEAEFKAIELAQQMAKLGIEEIVYTDIKKDGTLKGPNIQALQEMATSTTVKIIASGGVSSLEDLRALLALQSLGVSGVIIGQALYTGRIQLREALNLVTSGSLQEKEN